MVAAMLMGAKEMQQEKMMKLVMAMMMKEQGVSKPAAQTMIVPYPMLQQQTQPDDEMKMMHKIMKKMMMKMMMKKMMGMHDMSEDEDMDMDNFRGIDNYEDEFGMEDFVKAVVKAAKATQNPRRTVRFSFRKFQ